MKPLTKCQPYLWRELDGTPSIVVIDTESGSYYRASEADASIAELEAELAKKAEGLREVGALALRHAHELEQRRAQVAALEAERDAARADAERYRQDAERMAWIDAEVEKHSCVNIKAETPTPNGWRAVRVFSVSSQHTARYGSAREAIDAARSKE